MAKFKVGDVVRYVRGDAADFCNKNNVRGTITKVAGEGYCFDGSVHSSIEIIHADREGGEFELELVTPASPIKNVSTTRREIVDGWIADGTIELGNSIGGLYVHTECVYSPEMLRAAAKLFNELADVLDENSKDTAKWINNHY